MKIATYLSQIHSGISSRRMFRTTTSARTCCIRANSNCSSTATSLPYRVSHAKKPFCCVTKSCTALFAEAIATFTARHPVEFPGNVSLRDYSETLVDIAYEVGRRQYRLSSNSRETVRTIIGWADEFSRRHENTDWSTIEYLDEIDNFTEEKLRTARTRHDESIRIGGVPGRHCVF